MSGDSVDSANQFPVKTYESTVGQTLVERKPLPFAGSRVIRMLRCLFALIWCLKEYLSLAGEEAFFFSNGIRKLDGLCEQLKWLGVIVSVYR